MEVIKDGAAAWDGIRTLRGGSDHQTSGGLHGGYPDPNSWMMMVDKCLYWKIQLQTDDWGAYFRKPPLWKLAIKNREI